MGVFTKVLSGPAWHRVHHGRPIDYYDKNFAAFFPFYDIIFGTYKAPDPEAAYTTGICQRPQAQGGLLSLLLALFGFRADKPVKKNQAPEEQGNWLAGVDSNQ